MCPYQFCTRTSLLLKYLLSITCRVVHVRSSLKRSFEFSYRVCPTLAYVHAQTIDTFARTLFEVWHVIIIKAFISVHVTIVFLTFYSLI